jgi:transposase-like protein
VRSDPRRIATIRAFVDSGRTIAEAARKLGMHKQHAWRLARRHGLVSVRTRRNWTRDEALAGLRQVAAELGRTPTAREMGTLLCPSTAYFRKHFGSINNAIQAAGLELNAPGRRAVPPIDPLKANEITRAKQAYWANGGKVPTTWVHPYRQRSA